MFKKCVCLLCIILSCYFLMYGYNKKDDLKISSLNVNYKISNNNLMNRVDEQIDFNGKQTNISIFEYESYEREVKIGEMSIELPAQFYGYIYEKTVAEDLDGDGLQELILYFRSLGTAACNGMIILKVNEDSITEIPLLIYDKRDNILGLKANISFTDNYEVIVDVVDYSTNLKLDLDEGLRKVLYTDGKLNSDILKGVDCVSVIKVEKDEDGKDIIVFYQSIWAPVHVQRICYLVTKIKIDNNKSEIVDIYLLK